MPCCFDQSTFFRCVRWRRIHGLKLVANCYVCWLGGRDLRLGLTLALRCFQNGVCLLVFRSKSSGNLTLNGY